MEKSTKVNLQKIIILYIHYAKFYTKRFYVEIEVSRQKL